MIMRMKEFEIMKGLNKHGSIFHATTSAFTSAGQFVFPCFRMMIIVMMVMMIMTPVTDDSENDYALN